MIKIEKKIIKKRYYLDLLNEGSSTVLARAIDITSASAPGFIKKLSNRNKREETIITNPKEEQRGSYRISLGVARPGLGQNQHHLCDHLSFFGREEQWQKQVGVFLKK